SDLIVYFAIHHAAQLLDLKAIDKIGQKYPDIPILQPNIGFASHFQGKTDDFGIVIQAANLVLATNPDDWLALEMRFMRFEAETFNYPKVLQDSSNMDEIYRMIAKDSRFKFYNTVLYNNLAIIAEIDGRPEEWNRCNQIALETAREHDDQVRLAYCLTEQSRISSSNRVLARKLLLEALDIMDNLGSTDGYCVVLQQLGTLAMIRGELTSAIESFLKVVSIRERLDTEYGIPALMLSSLYNIIGEFDSGLEWGRMADAQLQSRPYLKPRAVMCQVWSLAHLDRLAEAELILDIVHESIMKSGRESHLGWLNFVIGIIEFAKGNATVAMSSIEESLKIFEASGGSSRYRSIVLYYLAKIEVALADVNTVILPYLALLEERAVSEDLPGILGQALLLKSELALIRDDDSTLRDSIQQLMDLAKEPGLSYLLPFIENIMIPN
ncbi:MAG: hypothetical protein RTU63_03150, partial [Candidatus Thorarchaeota archaeon]